MRETRKSKAQNQQQSDRNLAALELVIENAALSSEMIKALRLTCKRTKEAADGRVKDFSMTLNQEPEAVKRSGLLNNITILEINFYLAALNEELQHPERLSRALGLLTLAVDVCSKSVKVLHAGISGPQLILSCACLLGNCVWESLEEISTLDAYSMPGLLSGMLARPGCLPALKKLMCREPSAGDIEALNNSKVISTLTFLSIAWSSAAYASNIAPPMIAAMRSLLQKASKVVVLSVTSSTFDFFDCEDLAALKTLYLETPDGNAALEREEADFAPVLVRPWTTLETFSIISAYLSEDDMVRIFEAEDTLPALEELSIERSILDIDTVGCLRRPHLEYLILSGCSNGHELITKLTQLMKAGTSALPSLRKLSVNFCNEDSIASAREALSEFLSCPQMATLERLSILQAQLSRNYANLLSDIANQCPNLKYLNLCRNKLGRPAVALLHGLGNMGAFPQLEKIVILKQDTDAGDADAFTAEHPFMPPLDVQGTLRRVWPGLECS